MPRHLISDAHEWINEVPTVHEKPKETIICIPGRTHNRIRSPRLAASGQQNNVGKGSRQNRTVTSGNGLALKIGCMGPFLNARLISYCEVQTE